MDWEPYMEMAIKNQETLEGWLQDLISWRQGQRPEFPLPATGIVALLFEFQNNPQNAYKLVTAILNQQAEFNKAVIAMLTDLDNRKSEPGTSG